MSNKEFITRFVLWAIFACAMPFTFIAWRYDLFTKVSKVSLSGWGIIALIILFFFIKYCLKMLKEGQPYSMFTQLVSGIIKIILPLVVLLVLLNSIKDNIDLCIQSLTCVIVCETIAIPLNPLPKWVEANKESQAENRTDKFISKLGEWYKGKDNE